MTEKRSSKTFILITSFMSLFALVGFAYYGLPFFFDFMVRDFGYSRSEVTSGIAVGRLIVAPLFGFVAGWLIDRYGPRPLMMFGSIVMGIAFIGLSYSSSLWIYYSFYVLFALGNMSGGPLACQVIISRWFTKNRGKAMGIAYLGIGTGGALVPLLANKLEAGIGWQHSLSLIGILIVVISFPLAYFIRDPQKHHTKSREKREATPMRDILRSKNFYLLAIGSMCSIGAVGGVGQHLKFYLTDLNYSQSQAASIFSLVLFSSLAGRLAIGWLADILNRKHVMMLVYLIVTLAIITLLLPDFQGRIYVFAVVFGIGLGGDYMIIPLMAGDLFGVKALGRIMGIILVADGIAESFFPVLLGHLYNDEIKYSLGFTVLIFVALTGALIISFLPKSGGNSDAKNLIEAE